MCMSISGNTALYLPDYGEEKKSYDFCNTHLALALRLSRLFELYLSKNKITLLVNTLLYNNVDRLKKKPNMPFLVTKRVKAKLR